MELFNKLQDLASSRSSSRQYEALNADEVSSDHDLERHSDSSPDLEEEKEVHISNTEKYQSFALDTACAALLFVVPSFLFRFVDPTYKKPERKLTETSYLNGVRGAASFCVYIQHILYAHWIHYGYGARPEDVYIIQMPIIRLLFSGRFMVATFFILSGYVLSYKPLQLARKHDSAALFDNLSSAIFRRIPRLFLPIIPVMFITATFIYTGCYDDTGFSYSHCIPSAPSLLSEYYRVLERLWRMVDPSHWEEFYPAGTPQLWTLPIELKGSIIVFTLTLLLGNTQHLIRFSLLLIISYFMLSSGRWDMFLFINGMIFAELRIYRNTSFPIYNVLQIHLDPLTTTILKTLKTAFWSSIFITALFIGSWPSTSASKSPGFVTLSFLTPSSYHENELTTQYFWISISATFLILSLENIPILQKLFTTNVMNYMGDISFGFYIVHWTILFTVGKRIVLWWKEVLPWGGGDYGCGYWVGITIVTGIVFWVADLEWRFCDLGAVRGARWLEGVCRKGRRG